MAGAPYRPADLSFRRQHPAGRYVLDFFCPAHRLAVEVDGDIHSTADAARRDQARDASLDEQGIRVLRIPARKVLTDLDAVVRHIVGSARGGLPLHQPLAGPPPPAGED